MHAFRCQDCGDTRWSLIGPPKPAAEQGPCRLCGGSVVPERRTPSVSAAGSLRERREAMAAGAATDR